MKRPVVTAVFLIVVASLAGCPIYDHSNQGCFWDRDCAANYACDQHSGECVLSSNGPCAAPSDCDPTATCTPAGVCVPGDCTFNDCVAGYRCDSSSGVWQCVADANGGGGASGQAGESSGASGAAAQSTGGVAAGG